MYQVIKMYGDWEPWWFLEDWKNDIIEEATYVKFEDAFKAYEKEWLRLKSDLPSYKSHKNLLAAFWDKSEQRWCEECDEYLQRYHSILLLKDGQELTEDYSLEDFEQRNATPELPSSCAIKR
jgi:hypothetical protein